MAMKRACLFLLLALPTSHAAAAMGTCPEEPDSDLCEATTGLCKDDPESDLCYAPPAMPPTMGSCPDDPDTDLCDGKGGGSGGGEMGTCPDDPDSDLCMDTCPDDPDSDLCDGTYPTPPPVKKEPVSTLKVEMDAKEAQKPETFTNVAKGCAARSDAVLGAGKGECRVSVKLEKTCSMVMEKIPTGDVYKVLMKSIGKVDAGLAWDAGRSSVTRGSETFTKDTKVGTARRLSEALRRLAEPLDFSIATTVNSASELSSATSQADAGFKTKLQSAMTTLASSAGVDATAVAAAQPTTINAPTEKATVEMAIVAADADLPADTSALQTQLADKAALVASVNKAVGSTLVSADKVVVDRCADRTCGGQGTCEAATGMCKCNAGYSGTNCLTQASSTTAETENVASFAKAGGLAAMAVAAAAAALLS